MQILRAVLIFTILLHVASGFIKVDPKTQFFIDEHGRVRLFHGVNAVYKIPPWYPQTEGFDPLNSLSELDAANLSQWGFNFVRLGMMWPGVEPAQGQFDAKYLDTMGQIVETLGKYGIYTLLDFHQDIFNRKFCGEGFPDWATPTDAELPFPLPVGMPMPTNATNGYPDLDSCLQRQFAEYYFSDSVGHAFQGLYDNVNGLQDNLNLFWDQVSSIFNWSQSVIGYELINEPWPGDVLKYPYLVLEPGKADQEHLAPMYKKLHTTIRKNDDQHIIFFEKALSDIVFPCGFTSGPGGPEYNDRQAYSYHVYCGDTDSQGNPKNIAECDVVDDFSFQLVFRDHKRIGGGGMMTEFGAVAVSQNSVDAIDFLTSLADANLQGWSYWQFKYFQDLTTSGSGEGFYYPNGTVEVSKLKSLSRTYAPAIAGIPTQMLFDPDTANFQLNYQANTDITAGTVIFLNEQLYYPNGFTVGIEPAGSATYNKTSTNYLLVSTSPSTKNNTMIWVNINPK